MPKRSTTDTLHWKKASIEMKVLGVSLAGAMVTLGIFFTLVGSSESKPTREPVGEDSLVTKDPAPVTRNMDLNNEEQSPVMKDLVHGKEQPENQDQTPEKKPVSEILSAVVKVRVDDGNGSGFLFKEPDLVVTNFHVVDGTKEITIIYDDGTERSIDGFCHVRVDHDLVVLSVKDALMDKSVLQPEENPSQPGAAVLAVGSPLGLSGSIARGTLSARRTWSGVCDAIQALETKEMDPDSAWVQTDTPISPGNSGSPLVNEFGEVIAVNTCSLVKGQNLNFAVDIKHVTAALNDKRNKVYQLSMLPKTKKKVPKIDPEKEEIIVEATKSYLLELEPILKKLRTGLPKVLAGEIRNRELLIGVKSRESRWPQFRDELFCENYRILGEDISRIPKLDVAKGVIDYGRQLQALLYEHAGTYRQITEIRPNVIPAKYKKTVFVTKFPVLIEPRRLEFSRSQQAMLEVLRTKVLSQSSAINKKATYDFDVLLDVYWPR